MAPDSVDTLIHAYFNGTVDDAGFDRLQAALLEDDHALSMFLDLSAIHLGLQDSAADGEADQQVWADVVAGALRDRQIAEMRREALRTDKVQSPGASIKLIAFDDPPRRWAGWPVWLTAAAVALLVGLGALLLFSGNPAAGPGSPDRVTEARVDQVALLTLEQQAQWGMGSPIPATRGLAAGESFDLRAGLAELRFSSGNTVVLEGPATGRVVDAWTMVLDNGRVVARSENGARGFAVQTAVADFVDLGTEFGVQVTFGRVDAVVFDGLIAVRPRADGKLPSNVGERVAAVQQNALVTEREHVQVSVTGQVEVSPITRAEVSLLYRRSAEPVADRYLAYSRAVIEDRPLLYWNMQDIAEGVVRNAVDRPEYDAGLRNTPLMPGGLGGGYLAFGTDPQEASSLYPDQPLRELDNSDTYTIACWFRAASFHRGELANLFVKDEGGEYKDQVHLELIDAVNPSIDSNGVPRSIRFVHRDQPSNFGGRQIFTKAYPLGRWVHVVCVKDGQQLAVYIDGQKVAEGQSGNTLASDLHMSVGVAQQGHNPQDLRPLIADIDEFAIYRHALTPQQIQRHYQLGQEALNPSF